MKTNKIEHTKKAILEALEKSLGVVTTACKQVGVGRTTFYEYLNKDENFANEVADIIAATAAIKSFFTFFSYKL